MRGKILFLLLPIAISVNAVEILNESKTPEYSEPEWKEDTDQEVSTTTPTSSSHQPSKRYSYYEEYESDSTVLPKQREYEHEIQNKRLTPEIQEYTLKINNPSSNFNRDYNWFTPASVSSEKIVEDTLAPVTNAAPTEESSTQVTILELDSNNSLVASRDVVLRNYPILESRQHVYEPSYGLLIKISNLYEYKCPQPNGFFGIYNDCESFIDCMANAGILYRCPNGYYFDREVAWPNYPCNLESKVRCVILPNIIVPPTFDPVLPTPSVITQNVFDFECPEKDGYFAVKDDCDKFVRCKENVPIIYKCPMGYQFKRQSKWPEYPCGLESEINCKSEVIIPSPTEPTRPSPIILIQEIFNYSCSGSNGYFDYDNDCIKFVGCQNNRPTLYSCPDGYQYNTKAEWPNYPCALESEILCKAKIIIPPTINPPRPSLIIITRDVYDYDCPRDNGYFAFENDCVEFIGCRKSRPTLYSCPAGYQYNREAEWPAYPCGLESEIHCKKEIPPTEPTRPSLIIITRDVYDYKCPSDNGFYVFENDCVQFIGCRQGRPSLYSCPAGYQYNRKVEWPSYPCGLESEILCKKEIVIPPPTEPSQPAPVIITRDVYDYNCPKGNGYFVYENDCVKFIGCQHNRSTLYSCPAGYQYNRKAIWPAYPCGLESEILCKNEIVIPPTVIPPRLSPIIIAIELQNYKCPKSNGYFVYENDCVKFVGCQQSRPTLYSCPAGYQYNPEAEWPSYPCDLESEILCKEKIVIPPPTKPPKLSLIIITRDVYDYDCPKDNGYFTFENDCVKFIGCEQNRPTLYSCPSGYQYNHKSELPAYPCSLESEILCKKEIIIPLPTPPPRPLPIVISKDMYYFDCPKDNGYFKFGTDCSEFIQCRQYRPILYSCPAGYQYNRKAEWPAYPCGLESEILCKKEIVIPTPTEPAPAILSRDVYGYDCPRDNGYFVFDNDCVQFIGCRHSRPTLYSCPAGYQYNRKAEWPAYPCGLESQILCKKEIVIPPPTEPTRPSPIVISRDVYDYNCPRDNGYFVFENDCVKFIGCVRNRPTLYSCPPGYQYNRRAAWLEYPCGLDTEIQCKTEVVTPRPPEPSRPSPIIISRVLNYQCSRRDGYFKVEDDCEKFVECKHDAAIMYKCPVGYRFNSRSVWPEYPCGLVSEVRCEINSFKTQRPPVEWNGKCDGISYGIYPYDSVECSKYVICEHGTARIMPCPSGLVYNPEKEACDWPVNVPSCNPNVFHGFSCPEPKSDRYGRASEEISKFRYEQECSKYIACQQGHPRLLSCDHGLYYSEETESCVNPDLVHNCKA